MLKPLSIILTTCVFLFGCGKTSKNPSQADGKIKLTLLSGNNQTAITGNPLPDSVAVMVTKNGSPLANFVVQFTDSGCNSDLIVRLQTNASGKAKYNWRLAGNIGPQTLSVVALNGSTKADSTIVSAIALTQAGANPVNLFGACTPTFAAENLVQLTSGRQFACFYGKTSMRYSDDNGISWNPVKSFGSDHTIVEIITTPQDEIFAATDSAGIFFSKDAGSTWADVTPPTFNKSAKSINITYSNSGSLIAMANTTDIFVSGDKGKTWSASAMNGLLATSNIAFVYQLNNADLYAVNLQTFLYKSSDGGKNWTVQNDRATGAIFSIFVDKNDWFYKSSFADSATPQGPTVLYVSKDEGQTFTALFTVNDFAQAMNVLQDGNFYYSNGFGKIGRFYNNQILPLTADAGFSLNNSFCLINQHKLIYINEFGRIKYTTI